MGLGHLGIADSAGELAKLRKGDERKAAIAMIVRAQTSASNEWPAKRLKMGHDRSVSWLIRTGKIDPEAMRLRKCYHAGLTPNTQAVPPKPMPQSRR
jgi:hypothetical protein